MQDGILRPIFNRPAGAQNTRPGILESRFVGQDLILRFQSAFVVAHPRRHRPFRSWLANRTGSSSPHTEHAMIHDGGPNKQLAPDATPTTEELRSPHSFA